MIEIADVFRRFGADYFDACGATIPSDGADDTCPATVTDRNTERPR